MEDKELTGPQVMWKFPLSPPPPQLLLRGWGPLATWRESFLSLYMHPPRLLCFLHTSLVDPTPFFPVTWVLGFPGFCPFNP